MLRAGMSPLVALLLPLCSMGDTLSSWQLLAEAPPPNQLLTMAFAVRHKPGAEALLSTTLDEVSDPSHPNYGKHLTLPQLRELAASDESLQAVKNVLNTFGAVNVVETLAGDFVRASITVAQAQQLLGAGLLKQYAYRQQGGPTTKLHVALPSGRPEVPEVLKPHVHFIVGVSPPALHRTSVAGTEVWPKTPSTGSQSSLLADGVDNRPWVLETVQTHESLHQYVSPRCENGQRLNMCGNTSNLTFVLRVVQEGDPIARLAEIAAPHAHCKPCGDNSAGFPSLLCSNPQLTANDVLCVLTVGGLNNYKNTSISLSTRFPSGDESDAVHVKSLFPHDVVNPAVLREWTHIPKEMHSTSRGNSQAFISFLQQYMSPVELARFHATQGEEGVEVVLKGPNNDSQPGGEAMVDAAYITSIGRGVPTEAWSFPDGWLEEYVFAMANVTNPPLVQTISYVAEEDNSIERVNTEFMKLGLRGVSILVSSGDNGIWGVSPGNSCSPFTPVFPASSPYVTSVGATMRSQRATPACDLSLPEGVQMGCSRVAEVGCQSDRGGVITSGSGFSNQFPQPNYQQSAVKQYLAGLSNETRPPPSEFNAGGRAYPDLAFAGHNYMVYLQGGYLLLHGTSASAPALGGFLALLNDKRLANGLPPLGFLNPLIYQLQSAPGAFEDIVVGSTHCAGRQSSGLPTCCQHGFTAAVGWDPVAGMGVPQFDRLAQLVSPAALRVPNTLIV